MDKQNKLIILILTFGVFGILNTEMGVIGILPSLAEYYGVSVSQAGLLVGLFALAIAIAGPTMPLLFSGIDRKKVLLLVLAIFVLGNIATIFITNFTVVLIIRFISGLFHPVYVSLAFTIAADSVKKEEAPKAIAKVFIGVSAGMVVGVPIVSFIASVASIQMALAFFAVTNALVLIATLLFMPSMPVKEKLSYGSQLRILKKSITWLSIIGVIFLNASVFGVYSYFAEFLTSVTNMPLNTITIMLFLFGLTNIIGNIVAGKLLTQNAIKTVVAFPFALGAVYILFFLFGELTIPMAIITLIWGIIAGIGANINQYWVMSSAPEAPTFANGLFLTSANIGVTVGSAIGGYFIAQMGTQYVILVGFISIILSLVFVFLRNYRYNNVQNNPLNSRVS
ncbi:MFS transporter [Halalkalibacter alkalisediminis]|uniref:MFS transporter n=1 Tax=Halalkalibacter alkalisediminis TaxID=935616 RepID=A0ABV6NJK2_9BACI|nr:MFS transporter [Halalkalibacter alkalisediminis]